MLTYTDNCREALLDYVSRHIQNYDGSSSYGARWHWAGAQNDHGAPLRAHSADSSAQQTYYTPAAGGAGDPQRRSFVIGGTSEGDQRLLYAQGRPMAKDSSSSGSNWATGTSSATQTQFQTPVESRFFFTGTVTGTDMSRATDKREKDRLGIFGTSNSYAGSYGRVTSEPIGRDLNPLGRGSGQAFVAGAMNLGRIAPRLAGSNAAGGSGNSVNNPCNQRGGCGLGSLIAPSNISPIPNQNSPSGDYRGEQNNQTWDYCSSGGYSAMGITAYFDNPFVKDCHAQISAQLFFDAGDMCYSGRGCLGMYTPVYNYGPYSPEHPEPSLTDILTANPCTMYVHLCIRKREAEIRYNCGCDFYWKIAKSFGSGLLRMSTYPTPAYYPLDCRLWVQQFETLAVAHTITPQPPADFCSASICQAQPDEICYISTHCCDVTGPCHVFQTLTRLIPYPDTPNGCIRDWTHTWYPPLPTDSGSGGGIPSDFPPEINPLQILRCPDYLYYSLVQAGFRVTQNPIYIC